MKTSNASEERSLIDRGTDARRASRTSWVRNHTSRLPRHSATTPTLLRNSQIWEAAVKLSLFFRPRTIIPMAPAPSPGSTSSGEWGEGLCSYLSKKTFLLKPYERCRRQ